VDSCVSLMLELRQGRGRRCGCKRCLLASVNVIISADWHHKCCPWQKQHQECWRACLLESHQHTAYYQYSSSVAPGVCARARAQCARATGQPAGRIIELSAKSAYIRMGMALVVVVVP